MQSCAIALDRCAYCLFVYQAESAVCCLMMNLPFPVPVWLWLISHSTWWPAVSLVDENQDIYIIKIDLAGRGRGQPETKVLLPRWVRTGRISGAAITDL